MSFQWIFDMAETISVDKRPLTSQTITRDQTVRATVASPARWRFEVKLPDGMRWSDIRNYIEPMEALDRYTTANVAMSNSGYSYINGFRGRASAISAQYASNTTPRTLTITSSSGTSAGQNIVAVGDWIQLGTSGKVYAVTANTVHGGSTISVHRPIIEPAGGTTYSLVLGQNCTFTVICQQMPTWTIFGYDQVSWSGPFIFYEVI